MKLISCTIAALGFVALSSLSAVAAPPADVPASHWAAKSVDRVVGKKVMRPRPDGKFHGSAYVTRYELAVTLDRFAQYIETAQKPLHVTALPAPKLAPGTPANVRLALTHLVTAGFLPAKSPLVTQTGNKPVTAQQLADAMAHVTVRLSDRSLPTTKEADPTPPF